MNVGSALYFFLFSYPGFLLELVAAEGMLLSMRRKRPYFWVFLIAGIFLVLAAAFLVCCLVDACGNNAIAGAVGYFLVFLCTLGVMRACFDVRFKILLFFGAGAYAFQNFCYSITAILENTGLIWLAGGAEGYPIAYTLISAAVFVLSAVGFWFFFARKVRAQGMENLYSGKVLLLSLVTLIVTIVFCSVTNSYRWMSMQLTCVIFAFSILANLFILSIQSGMLERIVLKSDIEEVRRLWQQDRRQYEIAKETIDLINVKCHDMKHKVRAVHEGSGISAEEAAEIESYISIYDARISTGCEPIDVLLTEKSLVCNQEGIRLSCMVDGKQLAYMREYDLYSLFGNILSNAIEAVQGIADKEKRIIDLTVRESGGLALVTCSNYYEGELRFEDGLPATSKEDVANHGFGLKSIRMLAEKYGGMFGIEHGGGVFTLSLIFPSGAKASGEEASGEGERVA